VAQKPVAQADSKTRGVGDPEAGDEPRGLPFRDLAFLLCRQLLEVLINDLGYVLKFFLVRHKLLLQIGLFRVTQIINVQTL
jgi:hypothetical protein